MARSGWSQGWTVMWAALPGAILVAVLDQLTKYLILRSFQLGEVRPVLEGFFNLVLVFNPGAAFGFLANVGDGLRHLLLGLTTAFALITVAYLFAREYADSRWARCAVALIVGGAIGNVVDRVRFGAVVDFLDFFIGAHHWPAFNVADSAICVGVGILLLCAPRREPEAKE